jgi:hypothetical protein
MATDDGLPRVEGLESVIQDLAQGNNPAPQPQQAQPPQGTPPPTNDGQGVDPELEGILKTFSTPDGKVRTRDILKSYKEIQGFTTRTSQENAALKAEVQKMKEEMEARSYAAPVAPPMPDQKTFDQRFIENPQAAIEEVATAKAFEMANTQRIAEILEEEEQKNSVEFQERVAYVKMLAQNPQLAPLARSPKGVRLLFSKADEYRKEAMNRRAHESLKFILGDDIDLDKLKAFVRKDGSPPPNNNQPPNSNAYMPDTTGSTRTGADLNLNQNALQVEKAEALKRGDPGGVAGALLREALLK